MENLSSTKHVITSILAGLALMLTTPAFAYIGPGAGLTAIGSFIALTVAILVAIVGFLWFPIKRMLTKRSETEATNTDEP